jgi:hypothetical protein
MTSIENVEETGSTVFLDGKYFTNCKYTKCTLIYAGGDSGWTRTQFVDCKLTFSGPASRTINILKSFNMLPQGGKLSQGPRTPPSSQSVN